MGQELITIIGIGCGLSIGSFFTYLLMTIRKLNKRIEEVYFDIPTPEDMAKEIVKIRLPISDLPPELVEKIKQGQMMPNPQPIPSSGDSSSTNKKRNPLMDYVG